MPLWRANAFHRNRRDHARHVANGVEVEALQLPAIGRRLLCRRIDHSRQPDIDAVNRLRARFQFDIEAPHPRSDQRVLVRRLDRGFFVQMNGCCTGRDLAKAQCPPACPMRQYAVFCFDLRHRNVPDSGRRGFQPFARAGARLLIQRASEPDRTARLRMQMIVKIVVADVAVGLDIDALHFRPVAAQFFRNHHRI